MNLKVIFAVLFLLLLAALLPFFVITSMEDDAEVKVSNVEMSYGVNYNQKQNIVVPVLDITIKNVYNSDVLAQNLTIDEKYLETTYFLIPAHQTRNLTFTLQGFGLESKQTYTLQLTFVFADESCQYYSTSYSTPQFKGQIQITKASVYQQNYNSSSNPVTQFFSAEQVPFFEATIQNSGTVPVSSINCTFDGQNYSLGINTPFLPNETETATVALWRNPNTVLENTSYPFQSRQHTLLEVYQRYKYRSLILLLIHDRFLVKGFFWRAIIWLMVLSAGFLNRALLVLAS